MIFIVVFHFDCSLVSHSIDGHAISLGLVPIGALGQTGVSLFFIISGAALMHTYQNKFTINNYVQKRFISIYPMFWTAYCTAFLYLFYINRSINHSAHKWTFILTVMGLDGYLLYRIPDFYILGEWFLGCIVLLYLCFPLLRIFTIQSPKVLIIMICIVCIIVIEKNPFSIAIDRNVLTVLPIFLFGMYFIRYIKITNIYLCAAALCMYVLILFCKVNVHPMYKVTIFSISVFIVLAFIGQHIDRVRMILKPTEVISKYSYAIFLTHHVIIEQMLTRFNYTKITSTESYCLFVIVCIVISITSVCLYKISSNLSRYLIS